jgi:hypothetical protein
MDRPIRDMVGEAQAQFFAIELMKQTLPNN